MIAQRFAQSNITMRRPKGWTEEQCNDIAAFIGRDAAEQQVVLTCWRPTPEELVKLNLGEPIWLVIVGETMPPVSLHMQDPWGERR